MCGIFAILKSTDSAYDLRVKALACSKKIRHRGPDWSGCHMQHLKNGLTNIICHERLSIVDPNSGVQPLFDVTGRVAVGVNGEIWNHMALRERLDPKTVADFRTQSDCEVIAHLYRKYGKECVSMLDGMFAFILADEETGHFIAARDHMGKCPLYIGWGHDGAVFVASEMKALFGACERFEVFPPGHYYSSELDGYVQWYNPPWFPEASAIPTTPLDLTALRVSFEAAVEKRMMADVPFGVLLSGGLDSSLVASIAVRQLEKEKAKLSPEELADRSWLQQLKSFSIGLPGSPDLKAAEKVAKFLGTDHFSFTFTIQEGLDALRDVIYHLETYDVTTIRASTPMYFLARKIKSIGVKAVISGEGADEVFGGYLYFHKAPNKEEFHRETVRKLKALHLYDCLRANKATQAWGLEARTPFLDRDFLELAMNIDPQFKMIEKGNPKKIEKWPVRAAFSEDNYLPDEILWRQKEQFSDGVGYGWIDALKDFAEARVSDQQMEAAKHRFPYNTPPTKEAYFYRTIFHSHFPGPSAERTVPGGPSIACSTAAALAWDAAWSKNADASGRALCGVHVSEKQFSDAEKAEKHVKAQLQKASGGKGEGGDEGDPHRVSPSLKKRRVTIEGDEPAPVNNGK